MSQTRQQQAALEPYDNNKAIVFSKQFYYIQQNLFCIHYVQFNDDSVNHAATNLLASRIL